MSARDVYELVLSFTLPDSACDAVVMLVVALDGNGAELKFTPALDKRLDGEL